MTGSQPQPLPNTAAAATVAGFWRRFFAFVIDGIILSVPAFCLGIVFFAQFARLGAWGRAIGFLVALLYFGLLNSALANGQTLGKRGMKIRVVGLNGSTISVPRSLLRYLILGAPFFLNGAAIPPRVFNTWVGIVVGMIIFGVGGSIIYLLVFNRRNRRSLHDLLVATYVASADTAPTPPNLKVWPGHYVVIFALLVVFAVGPLFTKEFAERYGYKDLVALQSALVSEPDIWYAAVFSGKGFAATTGRTTWSTTTSVAVWTDEPIQDYDSFANHLAQITFDTFPNASRSDRLILNITYGYDVGLATTRVSRGYDYSPTEWRGRIAAH
jgi:uncharacterized RDD family membrane protein YckC